MTRLPRLDPAQLRRAASRCGPWLMRRRRIAVVLGLPLLVNGVLWSLVAVPQHVAYAHWRTAGDFLATRPSVEKMLQARGAQLRDWEAGLLPEAAAIPAALERLSERHSVHVSTVKVKSDRDASPRSPAASTASRERMPVELELSGSFGKLGHWLSDLERLAGFHVDSVTISSEKPGQPERALVKLTAAIAPSRVDGAQAAVAGDAGAFAKLREAGEAFGAQRARLAPYDAVFRRNPMQPLIDEAGDVISSVGMSGGLFVQGIIWSPEQPLAVVDDRLLGPGETVGPYTIVAIEPDAVIVARDGEELSVPLDRGLAAQAAPETGEGSAR